MKHHNTIAWTLFYVMVLSVSCRATLGIRQDLVKNNLSTTQEETDSTTEELPITCDAKDYRDSADGLPIGISVSRCVTGAKHTSKPAIDRLQIAYESKAQQLLPLHGKKLSVYVVLNKVTSIGGKLPIFPMQCKTENQNSRCIISLVSSSEIPVVGSEGEVSAPDIFRFSRRFSAGIVNAWDVEFAFTDGNGNWDSNNSNNYKIRFGREINLQ